MRTILDDARHGLRRLRSTPFVSGAAILSLALAVGGGGAIFGAVKGLLLTPLPYEDPGALVRVFGTYEEREGSRYSLSYPTYLDFAGAPSLGSLAAWRSRSLTLTGGDRPERIVGVAATANLFRTLGVRPAVGRGFRDDEDGPGGERVVVLSRRLWERRFSSDPGVTGRTLSVDGVPYTVVGVMPRRFDFPSAEAALWFPLLEDASSWHRARGGLLAVGRLAPGASVEGLRGELAPIARRIAGDHPRWYEGYGAGALPLREVVNGEQLPAMLFALSGAVAFLLLIACIDIANLLLARAAGRRREVAVRAALGAGRRRVVRLFLTESFLLAGLGGVAGLGVAAAGVDLLRRAGGALSLPPGRIEEIAIDPAVLAFTVVLAGLTAVIFGTLPALEASRTDVAGTLHEGGRGTTTSAGGRRVQRLLVGAQVALALVVLTGAGLMTRSIGSLAAVDPGFRTRGALTFGVSLTPRYESPEEIGAFQEEVLRELRSLPGVRSVGAVRDLPLVGAQNYMDILLADDPEPGARKRNTGSNVATAGYFAAMGIPLLRGRTFDERDRRRAMPVVVVSRAMAESFWPGETPLGKRLALPGETTSEGPAWRTVIGVVGDVRHGGLRDDPRGEIYLPWSQLPWPARSMDFVVTASGDTGALAPSVRRIVRSVDPDEAVYAVEPLRELVTAELRADRGIAWILGVFGVVALLLAVVGIFGVSYHGVVRRRHELGIRVTLGAGRGRLVRMVLGQGLGPVLLGTAAGLGGSALLAGLLAGSLEEILYGVEPVDPTTFLVVPAILFATAAAAVYIPARRASRLDPVEALREE